ncbi:MAG: hypothetical protein AB7G93_07635 [Bdellovibrionales bacterium]
MIIGFFVVVSITAKELMADSETPTIWELKSLFLQSRDTLAVNDVDGVGKTTFWIALPSDQTAVISFTWNVRPGAKPKLERTVILAGDRICESNAGITYDFQSIKGSLSTPVGRYQIDANKSEINSVEVWVKSKRAYDFSALEKLVGKSPLKILKPRL